MTETANQNPNFATRETLWRALTLLKPFAGVDDHRPAINGICLEPTDKGLQMVATDGHRLAVLMLPNLAILGQEKQIIVHRDCAALKYLTRKPDTKGKMAENVALRFDGGELYLEKYDRDVMRFQTIDQTFPDWRRCMPKSLNDNIPEGHGVNASYLSSVASSVERAYSGGYANNAVVVMFDSDTKTCVIEPKGRIEGVTDVRFLIMLMRA